MHPATHHVLTNPRKLWALAKESVSSWIDDFAPSMGAAISYYTVFSIAPLLLIVIAVVGFVFGREAATGQIFDELRGLMGDEAAATIQSMVKSASDPGKGTIATIIGVVTLIFGATTVFGELQSALDRIWRAPAATKKEGIWKLVRTRVLSFGMILGIGFLLLVSLAASAGIAALSKLWGPYFMGSQILLQIVNIAFSLGVVTVLFALIYKFLPRTRISWRDVWIGAGVTAVLFTVGKFLIGLYLGRSAAASTFGAAGSLAVVLLWVYYSAQIFLLGAEFTWVYSYRYGSRQGEPVPEVPPGAPAMEDAATPRSAPSGESASAARKARAVRPEPARTVTAGLNRYPQVELGLAVLLAGLAALAARWSGRLR
ncbi:MAG: YihY/virulence factor BrkB family protein [Casimicrobiaceae bacterium]